MSVIQATTLPHQTTTSAKLALSHNGNTHRYLIELDLNALGPYTAGGWDLKDCLAYSPGPGWRSYFDAKQWISRCFNRCTPAVAPFPVSMDFTDQYCPKLLAYSDKGVELEDGFVAPEGCTICLEIEGC